MTNRQLKTRLTRLGACSEAVTWLGDRDLATAWVECPRGDWLLWLCAKQIGTAGWPTHQEIVLAACDCAEPALRYVPAGEDRPRLAIATARRWARGEATIAETRASVDAANAAARPAAANAAACAAAAAANAAACAAAASAYAYAAASAYAYAAASADAYACAAASAARPAAYAYACAAATSRQMSSDLVRARLFPLGIGGAGGRHLDNGYPYGIGHGP